MGEIDRRKFITRGVAGTAVAASASMWTPPAVMRTVSAAGASGTVEGGLCYKYQYVFGSPPVVLPGGGTGTLVDYLNVQRGDALAWNGECISSNSIGRLAGDRGPLPADRYKAWQTSMNKNCCIWNRDLTLTPETDPNNGSGTTISWWDAFSDGAEAVPTFPAPACITIAPVCDVNEDGFVTNDTVKFTMGACAAGCRFADPLLWYVYGNVNDAGNLVPGGYNMNQITTSDFYDDVTWRFNTEGNPYKFWPVSYMVWVLCDVPSDQLDPKPQPSTGCVFVDPGPTIEIKA